MKFNKAPRPNCPHCHAPVSNLSTIPLLLYQEGFEAEMTCVECSKRFQINGEILVTFKAETSEIIREEEQEECILTKKLNKG